MNIKKSVESVVQKLYETNGEVSASALLEAARKKRSPAHDGFTWDDTVAGEEYRLMEARKWLRIVIIRTENNEPEHLVHVPIDKNELMDSREGVYKPISIVVTSIDEFGRALNQAMHQLTAARRAVEELKIAAEKSDIPERAEMVFEVTRGLDIIKHAMQSVH